MSLEQQVRDAFAQDGVLSRAAEQFREREGQTQMALAVARTVQQGGVLWSRRERASAKPSPTSYPPC